MESASGRQQALRRERSIVILERKPLPNSGAEQLEPSLQPFDSRLDPSRRASCVQHDRIRSDHLGNRRLMLQLLHRCSYHWFALRVEHHELIGMQAQPHVVGPRQCAGPLECPGDRAGRIEPLQDVTGYGMSGQRKNLAVHAKGTNAELVAPLDGRGQCIRVVRGDIRQVCRRDSRLETRDISVSGRAEPDGRIEELTAEPPTEPGARSLGLRVEARHRSFTIHSPTK
jgi:hypothetical protein